MVKELKINATRNRDYAFLMTDFHAKIFIFSEKNTSKIVWIRKRFIPGSLNMKEQYFLR